MSETNVGSSIGRVRTETRQAAPKTQDEVIRSVSRFVFGISRDPQVTLVSPTPIGKLNEEVWNAFISAGDSGTILKRRVMLDQIDAVLEADDKAKAQAKPLAEVVDEEHARYSSAWERAVATLADQNKEKECAVRGLALFLENMQTSKSRYHGKIYTINASPEQISSEAGLEGLRETLSNYVNRPDPRGSRAFVIVPGWAGTTERLHKLSRVLDESRCMLISDGPAFNDMDGLRDAASEGGLLEDCGGDDSWLRHTVLLGNILQARSPFVGRTAEENEGCWIPVSGPWFGMYLDRIARGQSWKPPVGFNNPILGVDGVKLDLRLEKEDQFDFYAKHHINPAILRGPSSDKVVIWAAETLSKAGRGMQIGPAVVEMMVVRYTEFVMNKHGILAEPLLEAKKKVQSKLSDFIKKNSGADRMFRHDSSAKVTADVKANKLIVEYSLGMQELALRAEIRMNKAQEKGVGTVDKVEVH